MAPYYLQIRREDRVPYSGLFVDACHHLRGIAHLGNPFFRDKRRSFYGLEAGVRKPVCYIRYMAWRCYA